LTNPQLSQEQKDILKASFAALISKPKEELGEL
jgi:hypothetical protein